MIDPVSFLTAADRVLLKEEAMSDWLEPMLATLSKKRFTDPAWLFERKLDGERALLFKKGDSIRLFSRNRKNLADTYPELIDAFRQQRINCCILDGEIVAFKDNLTSFSALQKRMQIKDPERAENSRVGVFYYLFDILHIDSSSTVKLPLRTRKELLKRTLDFNDPLRFTTHRNELGEEMYQKGCDRGWEGVIAKKAQTPYLHKRSREWLKFKCVRRQELVIGGWTDPKGQRLGFGALLVGYYDQGRLIYAGKVGTGYDDETLKYLHKKMTSLRRSTSPFVDGDGRSERVHYVTPKLVAEIGFTEWTDDGRLRHPRYLGLRRDKSAEEVVREHE